MGLFDNLFLDQNTPVTINDGIDHSKDVVIPVMMPTESSSGKSGGKGDDGTQKDEKNDQSVSDLFASDKKEEIEANITLHPEEPTDIALEIGKGPIATDTIMPPADPDKALSLGGNTPTDMSFDIGGDISFDIGGDIGGIAEIQMQDNTSSVSPGKIDTLDMIGDTISTISPPEIHEDKGGAPDTTPLISESTGVVNSLSVVNSEDSTSPELKTPEAISLLGIDREGVHSSLPHEEPLPAVAPSSPPSGAGLFSLLGSDEPTTPDTLSEKSDVKISGTESNPIVGDIPPSNLTNNPENTSTDISSLLGGTPTIHTDIPMSSQLKEKLFSYVDELKNMQLHDQNQRTHKMEQISVLKERIREIDIEASARKKFIHMEIDTLHLEIMRMDKEKEEIKNVVASFQQEIQRT